MMQQISGTATLEIPAGSVARVVKTVVANEGGRAVELVGSDGRRIVLEPGQTVELPPGVVPFRCIQVVSA